MKEIFDEKNFSMKEINKEIMSRSRLRNKCLRCRSDLNKKAHNEQRNRCVKLVRNSTKQGGEGRTPPLPDLNKSSLP